MAFQFEFHNQPTQREIDPERRRLEILASRTKFATGDMDRDIENFLRMKSIASLMIDMMEPEEN